MSECDVETQDEEFVGNGIAMCGQAKQLGCTSGLIHKDFLPKLVPDRSSCWKRVYTTFSECVQEANDWLRLHESCHVVSCETLLFSPGLSTQMQESWPTTVYLRGIRVWLQCFAKGDIVGNFAVGKESTGRVLLGYRDFVPVLDGKNRFSKSFEDMNILVNKINAYLVDRSVPTRVLSIQTLDSPLCGLWEMDVDTERGDIAFDYHSVTRMCRFLRLFLVTRYHADEDPDEYMPLAVMDFMPRSGSADCLSDIITRALNWLMESGNSMINIQILQKKASFQSTAVTSWKLESPYHIPNKFTQFVRLVYADTSRSITIPKVICYRVVEVTARGKINSRSRNYFHNSVAPYVMPADQRVFAYSLTQFGESSNEVNDLDNSHELVETADEEAEVVDDPVPEKSEEAGDETENPAMEEVTDGENPETQLEEGTDDNQDHEPEDQEEKSEEAGDEIENPAMEEVTDGENPETQLEEGTVDNQDQGPEDQEDASGDEVNATKEPSAPDPDCYISHKIFIPDIAVPGNICGRAKYESSTQLTSKINGWATETGVQVTQIFTHFIRTSDPVLDAERTTWVYHLPCKGWVSVVYVLTHTNLPITDATTGVPAVPQNSCNICVVM